MGTVSSSQHYYTFIPCSRFKNYEDHYVITYIVVEKAENYVVVFLQHNNRSKRTLLGLICRTTRTDKEIHIETADISSQKERPCQLMQKWYHPI
jgi:ABC-type enterochelin transport system ATPase subunit